MFNECLVAEYVDTSTYAYELEEQHAAAVQLKKTIALASE